MNADLQKALHLLSEGDVVGLPTETVYGLAARVDRLEGLQKIFSVKERPLFDPLIVHVSSLEMARQYTTSWSPFADLLAKNFWPGPLTLVLPKSELVPLIVTSGLETVGLRMPRNALALELISQAGVGLAAPSANRFGRTSPTRWEHVDQEFSNKVFCLKSDPSEIGIESTVLEIKGNQLFLHRQGAISKSQIESVVKNLGLNWSTPDSDKRKSPGQMKHHYMPEVPLVFVYGSKTESEIIDCYRKALPEIPDQVEGVQIKKATSVQKMKELKLSVDPALAARELYHLLRATSLDADLIYFRQESFMSGEPWEPILERLTKASCLKLH